MNKQTFLELMKAPEKISEADFVELETLVKANPYFQNGHTILAHASKRLKKSASPRKMGTAAIYATNRNIFKQYILGQIKFGQAKTSPIPAAAPKTVSEPKSPAAPTAPRKAPTHNTDEEQNALVKEIYENLEKWKASREHYLDYDKRHPEEIVIEDPFASKEVPAQTPTVPEPKIEEEQTQELTESKTDEPVAVEQTVEVDDVEKLKNQVVEEIEAEEESISKALSEITEKKKGEEKVEPAAKEISEEPKAEENPTAAIPTISSDELTAIVDAESSESNDEASDTQDSDEDIVQSIEAETKVEISVIEEETIIESELASESIEIEESTPVVGQIENKLESEPQKPQKEEEEIELAVTIDVSSDKSTEETEEELDQIDKEIQKLKLTPGSIPTGKKFRLGVLKVGTKFTKERVKKTGKAAAPKKAKAKVTPEVEPKTTTSKKVTAKKETTEKVATKTVKSSTAKTVTKKEPAARKATASKKVAKAKKEDPVKKEATKKDSNKATASKKTKKDPTAKAPPKAETAKKETTKKSAPKFRMSATLGAKTKKKTTAKKTTKKDDESSSEKKKPKEVSSSTSKTKKGTTDQSNIIDSFIELNPSIQVSKDKQVDELPVEDLAARYDAFPDHLVTENLANILISQDKVGKAIDIYQKLILKNPQKKAYFASQIEKLNKK